MFGDTRDQISETEDEYENGIPTTWKASEDNVRKIGTNPWFQDMQQNYYKQLQYTIANAPEHKKLDVANQLSVDSTLSLLYGMTPTEAHENRNRLMYDIMGQQMDDKSWLQAFSDSFSSFDRNFVTSLKAYQLMFIKDPAKRVKLQQEIDDRNLKEATVYKDLSNRNWLSKFVVLPGANILNQVMITLASALVGGAVGTSIAGAPALGLTTTLPATTGVALIDGQLRDVSAKGALGWVLAKAGVPGIASSAGPQAIGSTIGTIASTVATMYPMAAGQSYLEMKSYVDAKGNHMSDDIAVPFAMLAGFGETALEFLTQTPVTDRVMKGVLGRTMPNLHEASRYAWGTMFKYSGNVILDAAKSIHNESFEEGVQRFYDEFTYWVAKFASNQTDETRFDMDWKSDLWDIFKDGLKTYVQSLGPMTLAAGGDAVLNLGMGANITRKMQAEADSMFADSKQGVAVDINSVFIGKHEMGGNRISDESDVNTDLNGSEKSDVNTDLSSEDDEYIRIHHLDETGRTKSADEIKAGYLKQKLKPITVVQDERTGAYIPLNDSDKDVVSDLQNAGVGAVKVRVVSAKDGTMESSEYTGETVNRLALQLGASIAKDDQNTIVLPDQESVDAVAQDLRENETVYEEDVDTKTGGPVTLYLLDEDGKSVKITLSAEQELQTIEPDQKYIDRIEAPHIASTMSLENYARKRERDTVIEKVKAGMGGGDPLRVTEMADTILTVSGLTHIPSSTLADNIRVATDATEEDEWNALMTAAKQRGYSGDAAVEFAEKQAGKVNGWKENNGGGRYTIHLTKYATESTIVHEMGHIMRELLGNDKERLAEFESIYGKKGSTWVTDVVDNKDGTYSLGGLSFASYQAAYKKAVENEERFANDFVRYMKEGVAPTEGLRDVFSRMKTILKGLLGIYAQDLDPAVRKAFEDLYAQNDREKAGGAGTGTLFEPAASQAEYGETEERLRADPKNFDGEGRHLAPNGKPSRLTYRQWVTVRTPAFKAWFGDWEHDPENASKVVDENGEPKVVYHHTTENFSVFREGKNGGLSGNGIYFSEYPLWQFGPVQIQAFLDIRHPITSETELDGMHEINSSGLPTRFIPDVLDRFPQFDGVMNHDEMTVRSSNQVKSATDNNGDFAIENENILFQTASDYVVRRASDIMDMALDPGIDAKTLRKKLGLNKNNKYSVNDIQRALAEFYKRATENRVDFTDLKDPDNIRNFARIYANEIEARLRRMPGETPIGWYSKNVEDALKIYSLVYPELADDNYKYPFLASLAITSQGETVEHNSDVAGRMYEYYKEHGVFPTSKKEIGTTKWGPMAANFEKLNLILSMLDNPDKLKIELLKVYSVRNIEKMTGYSVSGESKDEELPLSAIFGPKIGGAFMANLFGDYSRFTMDKWMSRSLYRFTGKNINNDEMSSFLDHAEKLRDELRSTGNDIHYAYTVEGKKFAEIKLDEEYTLDDLMEDDELLKKYADALTKDIYSKTQTVDGETGSYNARLRVPVTTVAKTLSQNKMASESFNSEERQFFRAVSHEIQDILDAENPHDGKHFVEITDIQAIMWYNEKNLYDKIQSQQKTSIGTSYSEAARKFAQKKGVLNEGEINRDTLGSSSGIRPAGQGRDLPVLERDDQPTSLGQVQGDHGAEPEGWRSSTPSVYEWFKSNPKGVRRYLADSRLDHDGQEPARGSYVREHLEGEKRDVWELGLGENPSDKQKKAFGALDRYIKRFRLYFGKNKYTAKAIYSPSRQFRANLVFAQNKTDVALNLNDMYEIEASDSGLFIDRITAAVQAMKDSGTHPEWMRVDIHDDAYYKGSRLFLNKKGTVGFALHGDDIVSVFSDPSEKKSIYSIIPLAVSEGGRRLDCYAGQLPAIYSKFGFYPVGKYAWNDAYWDPARWDKSVMGTPDIVYMVYGLPSADAIDYLSYYSSPNAEDAPYFGADDDPEEAQSKALGRNGGIMFEGYDWDMMRYAFPIDSQRVVKADSDGITSEDRSENGDVLLVGGNNADGKSYLNDYKAALVPSYMPDNDKEILRSHGLDVVPYGIGERDSALIKYLDGNGTNETSGEQSGSNGLMFEPTQEENEQYTKEWYADVQKAVEEHYLVPDEVLEKFKGEDWADREMRFRATLVLPENQWWFEEAMAADDFDAYVDALNKKQTDEGKEPFDINLQEHSGEDYDWAKRIWDYAHLKSPVQKDREFVKNMTADRSTMISYAKTLRGYLVPQAGKRKKNGTVIYGQRYVYNSWPGVSTKVSHLSYKSTEEEVEAAKELVRANPHPYRRAFDYSVRQTQEAKETAAGGAYSSYGQEEYLENVGDNALDAWRAVERDAAKRELQKLREEKRNVKLGDLGVTDKTVKTVTEEEKKNPDIKDATAAKDATQEQATVKEATLTDKRLAKAKRKIKELKQTLADTEQELSATSDEYDDLLKSLGIADKESSDKIDFLKAYGKEKARQAKDLEEKLADRRNRVSELRSQLTDANEELRKTTSHSETLQNRLDTIKAKQVVAGLRSILKRVSSQSDSVDANVYDAFFLIHDRLLKDKGTGLVDIETDGLHYDYESAINQISYYVASTEGASPNIVNHLVDGDSLSAWTPQELADLASVLSDMRKDAQVSLARKKMERMQRLHDEAYVLYREITGQNGSLTYDDQMDVWLLNNDVVDNIKKKKDNALEGFSLAFSKMQRVARVVDGNREGVVYDRFVRKAWESNMQELRGVSKRLDAADKEMKRLKITDDWLAQEIYTYKSGATDVTLTRGQVIGLYVYSKNEVERAKLVAKQGNNISSADLASALALLSDNDKAWGDYMINDFAQNRERVADTYYQVYNRLLGWRENYFTMIGDGKIGDGEQDILDGPQQQKKRYVNKSMTKEIAERAIYPLKLDVTQSWISQVRKEEHFVAFADWSRDSQHLLQGSGAMGTIIQTKYGKHMLDTFQHYTNDVGSPNTMMTNMEQTLNRVISRGAVAMLSYNLLTTIKQLPAVMAAFGQVGVGEFYKAGVELITDRKRTLDMIYEKAPDIRDRYISQDVQRAVETKAANKVDKVIKGVGEVGLRPVQFFDQAVATQLWYAAYLTNLNKGLSEQEAVFKASQLISETQNTNQVTDLSEIQRTRNPFTRSAFLFTNQTMQYFNFVRYDIGFYKATGQKGKMFGTVANLLLNAGVMALVSGALLKRPSDDDDKDKWRRFATQYIGELLGQALPLVGSMIQEGMEGFSGSFISLFSSVGQMIKVAMSEDKGEGEKKERMKSSMKDLIVDGLAFAGAPATAGKRVILAISDSDWYYLFGTDWGKYGPGTFGNQE